MSSGPSNFIGSMLEGRYLIEEELGVGGIGAVYLARDLRVLGRSVVVKVLLEESFQNEYVVKKFRQEAEALSRVNHPNIVGILDFGEMADHKPYLVLQFIDGVSLRAILRPEGIELERAAQIIRQVSQALTAAHEKGILHRDLKPDNIMLQTISGEERVTVIDFGIAQVQDSVLAPKTIVTATAGTISYMSPEQLSAGALSPASDTYALGVIAFELVTGQKPFNPKSPFQLLEMQRAGLTWRPRDLRPELPEAAQATILKALAFQPEERYQRTRDFGSDLCRAMSGAPEVSTVEAFVAAKTEMMPPLSSAHIAHLNADAPPSDPAIVGAQTSGQACAEPEPTTGESIAPSLVTAPSAPLPPKRAWVFPVMALLLLGLTAGLTWAWWNFTQAEAPVMTETTAGSSSTTVPAPSSAPLATTAEVALNYSLTVQRMREGKAYKEPFTSTGREIFENGWRFRLNVSHSKPGYLYLLNEGLNARKATVFTVLYPIDTNAQLAANRIVQIPEAPQYYYFTGEAGTEKIWMIRSDQPVAEMEALKGLINPTDEGEITNPAQINAVRDFLSQNGSSRLEVIRDTDNKQTTLKATSNLLVHLAELEHH